MQEGEGEEKNRQLTPAAFHLTIKYVWSGNP